MKKIIAIFLSILFCIPFTSTFSSSSTTWHKTQRVYFSGGNRVVNSIYADLNDKTIRIESVLAKNQLGKVDYLKNIALQANKSGQKVIGAINGTFFSAYSNDPQPLCTIETQGKFECLSTSGSVIGFTGDNAVFINRLKVSVIGSINGNYDYPNNWVVWGFNNTKSNSDTIFTPAFGRTTGKHTRTSIVVENRTVTKIIKGEARIPSNGYTIVFRNVNYSKKFSIGDKVDFKLKYSEMLSNGKTRPISWGNVRTTVGAGPTLVKGSKILADGRLENFTENKINTTRAQRSFIGVTKENKLVMGTCPNVTVKELAAIVKKMGLYSAINLDGGASSGLYYGGKYLTTPGRKLSNAIVITKLSKLPLRLKLNSKELFYSNESYLTSSGIVMVSLKQLFATFGSQLNATTMTAVRGKLKFVFKTGSDIVRINAIDTKMNSAVSLKSGILYAPLEFLIKTFGGTVRFDNKTKVASISLKIINAQDAYDHAISSLNSGDSLMAMDYFKMSLELDSKHSGTILQLAKINLSKKVYKKAGEYYAKYFSINKKDYTKLASSGWSYYSGKYYDEAQSAFEKLTRLQPKVAGYWINLGSIYADYNIKKYSQARECFRKALTLNPTQKQKDKITAALARIQGK